MKNKPKNVLGRPEKKKCVRKGHAPVFSSVIYWVLQNKIGIEMKKSTKIGIILFVAFICLIITYYIYFAYLAVLQPRPFW